MKTFKSPWYFVVLLLLLSAQGCSLNVNDPLEEAFKDLNDATPVSDFQATRDGAKVKLTWAAHPSAVAYHLEKMHEAQSASPALDALLHRAPFQRQAATWTSLIVTPNTSFDDTLTEAGTYQYRVRAATKEGKFTPWAEVASFTVTRTDLGLDEDHPVSRAEAWYTACDTLVDTENWLIGDFLYVEEEDTLWHGFAVCEAEGKLTALKATVQSVSPVNSEAEYYIGDALDDGSTLTVTWTFGESFEATEGSDELSNVVALSDLNTEAFDYTVGNTTLTLEGIVYERVSGYPGGGADSYYNHSTETYAWNSAADPGNGTQVFGPGIDDEWSEISLPFSVEFFGQSATKVEIDSNGYVTLDQADSTYIQDVWLLDLDLVVAANGRVAYATTGSSPDRKFLVTYHNMYEYGNESDLSTFQIEFSEGSSTFVVRYKSVASAHELYAFAGLYDYAFDSVLNRWTAKTATAYSVFPAE